MRIRWFVRVKWAAWLGINFPVFVVVLFLSYVLGEPGDSTYIAKDYFTRWKAILTGIQQ